MKLEEHNKRAEKAQKQWKEDLREILSTAAGQRALSRVMDHTRMMDPDLFTGNSTTFYNLGKREVGLWLYSEIMAVAPGSFIKMMQQKLEEFENAAR